MHAPTHTLAHAAEVVCDWFLRSWGVLNGMRYIATTTTVSKETYYSVKRDLLQCSRSLLMRYIAVAL
jgi:hypothetical protein